MAYLVGRYVLVDPIAEGGMGSVWRVWDTQQHRYVAAKLLRPADAGSLLRFVREQSLRVVHPNVSAPTGWAAQDDQVLLTMDLVRGGSVADLLAGHGPLPVPYVAVLLEQLLSALVAVHEQGIVHRDVKPSNLLLEPTGRERPWLRLADFGIAAVLGEPRLTSTELVVGSPGYVAPEARSADPDVRQDLYGAGVVGMQVLTGQRPGADRPDRPGWVPEPIWDVLLALTAPSVEDRPDSARTAIVAWWGAVGAAGVPALDPAAPEAVDVPDRLGAPPDGFGPDGPLSAAPLSFPAVPPLAGPLAPAPPASFSGPPVREPPTRAVRDGEAGRSWRRIAMVAGCVAAAVAIAVALVSTAGNGGPGGSAGPVAQTSGDPGGVPEGALPGAGAVSDSASSSPSRTPSAVGTSAGRKASASPSGTAAVVLPVPALPAGGEQDVATASGAAPAGLPCRSITGAKICYQADGDTWWVEDTASDSASAVAVWRDYLGGALARQGMCVNSQGDGKWGKCVKDYDEASALYGAPCVVDRSANRVIRCDSAYRQYQ